MYFNILFYDWVVLNWDSVQLSKKNSHHSLKLCVNDRAAKSIGTSKSTLFILVLFLVSWLAVSIDRSFDWLINNERVTNEHGFSSDSLL